MKPPENVSESVRRLNPELYGVAKFAAPGDQAVTDEAKLHNEIVDECRRRCWPCFHGSMAHRTYRTPGEPDFIIAADNGRVLFVECKTKTGKLSPDQQGIKAWLEMRGHKYHVVWSMREFMEITK